MGHFGKKGRIYAAGVLHFSIFCVFIDEGGAFERKNLYIRSRVQHFGKKGCIYALGKKVPTLFGKIRNIRLGSENSEKSENISGIFTKNIVCS